MVYENILATFKRYDQRKISYRIGNNAAGASLANLLPLDPVEF